MEQVKSAEPVAWMYEYHPKPPETRRGRVDICTVKHNGRLGKNWTEVPLYANPQPAAVDGLVEALEQALDDMKYGLSVCLATKEMMAQALAQIERKPDV